MPKKIHRMVDDNTCAHCGPVTYKLHHGRPACPNSSSFTWKSAVPRPTEREKRMSKLPPYGGSCQICGKAVPLDKIHVDHDHATGAPRGYLCSMCNLGLGFFYDSPENLKAAALYVSTTADSV